MQTQVKRGEHANTINVEHPTWAEHASTRNVRKTCRLSAHTAEVTEVAVLPTEPQCNMSEYIKNHLASPVNFHHLMSIQSCSISFMLS